jgi:hypothetical protein
MGLAMSEAQHPAVLLLNTDVVSLLVGSRAGAVCHAGPLNLIEFIQHQKPARDRDSNPQGDSFYIPVAVNTELLADDRVRQPSHLPCTTGAKTGREKGTFLGRDHMAHTLTASESHSAKCPLNTPCHSLLCDC